MAQAVCAGTCPDLARIRPGRPKSRRGPGLASQRGAPIHRSHGLALTVATAKLYGWQAQAQALPALPRCGYRGRAGKARNPKTPLEGVIAFGPCNQYLGRSRESSIFGDKEALNPAWFQRHRPIQSSFVSKEFVHVENAAMYLLATNTLEHRRSLLRHPFGSRFRIRVEVLAFGSFALGLI